MSQRRCTVLRLPPMRPPAANARAGGTSRKIAARHTARVIDIASQSARFALDGTAESWPIPPRAVMASPISSARRNVTVRAAVSRSRSSIAQRRRRALRVPATGLGRSRRAAYSTRNSSISIGKARSASASVAAHSSMGIRRSRSGRPKVATAGAISATLVVHDTIAPSPSKTIDSAVIRRKFSSPPSPSDVPASVDHRTAAGEGR